ncbi:MAG TPA: hypothetical protein VGG28_17320 [Kofleriaceae bacterium]|jgi:hypothetical protein
MLVLATGIAHADGKRVVVLDFDGPKAEKFHDAIVKAIEKKANTVVATDKWNGAAEELQATKLNKRNARKIAKRLKVDGIVSATIEKNDEGYVVHLKLRAGKSGAVVAEQIDLKAEGTKLSKKEINDQLVGAIDNLEANGGGSKDEDGGLGGSKDEGDDDTAKKDTKPDKPDKADKTDKTDKTDKADKADKADKTDSATASTDDPPRHHHKKKDVAEDDPNANASVTETATVEAPAMTSSERLSEGNRAVDFGIGMSFTARHLSWKYSAALGTPPPDYKEGLPVAGGVMDAVVFPFAITHKTTGILTDIGIEVMYDKVIDISSKKSYIDATTMTEQTASLATDEEHFAVGAVFRYPVTDSFVAGAKLMYMNQQFEIAQSFTAGTGGATLNTDVPNVHYSAAEPRLFLHYAVTPGLVINAEGGFMLITKTGDITADTTGYGGATDKGYEFTGGVDYNLTKAIFARALFHFEEFSLTFHGDQNSLANSRDGMATTQDVFGARDYYYGGSVQIGYIY